MSKIRTVALLPFATPQPGIKAWGAFHPAAFPHQVDRSKRDVDEIKDYYAWSAVKIASSLSHTIIATIPPKSTPAGMTIDYLLKTFVDPENILSEVETIETDKISILEQVDLAFQACPGASEVVVLWPYQCFNADQPFAKSGNYKLTFSHPMLNLARDNIPECTVISTASDDKEQEEIEVKDVKSWVEIDRLLRGGYVRVVSCAGIDREELEAFKSDPSWPSIATFLNKTVPGKQALLTNPDGNFFI